MIPCDLYIKKKIKFGDIIKYLNNFKEFKVYKRKNLLMCIKF